MNSSTVYTIEGRRRGVLVWAGSDRRAALDYAQGIADADLAAEPYAATPHYVVDVWTDGALVEGLHVYGRPAQPLCAHASHCSRPATGELDGAPLCDEHRAELAHREAGRDWSTLATGGAL